MISQRLIVAVVSGFAAGFIGGGLVDAISRMVSRRHRRRTK